MGLIKASSLEFRCFGGGDWVLSLLWPLARLEVFTKGWRVSICEQLTIVKSGRQASSREYCPLAGEMPMACRAIWIPKMMGLKVEGTERHDVAGHVGTGTEVCAEQLCQERAPQARRAWLPEFMFSSLFPSSETVLVWSPGWSPFLTVPLPQPPKCLDYRMSQHTLPQSSLLFHRWRRPSRHF